MTSGNRTKQICFIVQFLMIAALLCYRIYLLLSYVCLYTDDDQAVMQYAVVDFAHGNFYQPAFYGQEYGTMLLSLLCVPFHLLGVPLNYVIPFMMMVFSLIAFLYADILLWKKGKYLASLSIICMAILCGVKYDIVTSLRDYFSGLPLCTIGCLMLCSAESKKIKYAFGSFLALFGVIITSSAAAVLGIVALSMMTSKNMRKNIRQNARPCLLGFLPAVIWLVCRKAFFMMHPDYINYWILSEFQLNSFVFCLGRFRDEIHNLFYFSPLWICLATLSVLIMVKRKMYRWLLITSVAVFGILFTFFSTRMLAFYLTENVICSQTRLLIYIVYLWLFMQTVILMECRSDFKYVPLFLTGFIVLSFSAIVLKVNTFHKERTGYLSAESNRNSGGIESVLYETYKETGEKLIKMYPDADIFVIYPKPDQAAYGYNYTFVLGSLYYDRYKTYHATFDRRPWMEKEMRSLKAQNIVLCEYNDGTLCVADYKNTGSYPVAEYLMKYYGLKQEIVVDDTRTYLNSSCSESCMPD